MKIPNSVEDLGFHSDDTETVIELLESISQLSHQLTELDSPMNVFPTRLGVEGVVTTFNTIEELNQTIISLKMGVEVTWRPTK